MTIGTTPDGCRQHGHETTTREFKFDDSVIHVSNATITSMINTCPGADGCHNDSSCDNVVMSDDTIKSVIGYHGKNTIITRVTYVVSLS